MSKPQILVIKLSAIGDFWICTEAFAAIRAHHADAEITLLTTRPLAELAKASPWFDEVWIDERPKFWQLNKWWALRQRLRSKKFMRVYDLQTSDRSGTYFKLFWPDMPPEWSGNVAGASHRFFGPARDLLHAKESRRQQLTIAGITEFVPVDYRWLNGELPELPPRIGLIVAGSAPTRLEKRWPIENYVSICRRLIVAGFRPVLLGTAADAEVNKAIKKDCEDAIDLTGQTNFGQIAALARMSHIAVGNDTGPMHLIAQLGCPTLTLFSGASNPELCRPVGRMTAILQQPNLANLQITPVWETIKKAIFWEDEDNASVIPAQAGIK